MSRETANEESRGDPRTNKMAAVRLAIDTLGYDASPADIHKYVLDNFGQDMNINMISSYKSNIREKAGLKKQRKKRRMKTQKTMDSTVLVATVAHDSIPWKDLRLIKDIAGRLGKKGLRELVELLD